MAYKNNKRSKGFTKVSISTFYQNLLYFSIFTIIDLSSRYPVWRHVQWVYIWPLFARGWLIGNFGKMDLLHIIEKFFEKIRIVKFITTELKSIQKSVKLQVRLQNLVKCEKYKPRKFANFTHETLKPFSRLWYQFSARNTNVYKICKFYRIIFFCTLQHFASKLCILT